MSIPTSPGDLRSSRKRALEIGTNPKGFAETPAYDSQAGVPANMAGGHYESAGPFVGGGSQGPVDVSKPFSVK
jgi:hypothetical protein